MNSAEDNYLKYQTRVRNGLVTDWLDGSITCFSCHKNVYNKVNEKDLTIGTITSCPHCHRSFVD